MKILCVSDLHLGDGSAADDFGLNDAKFIAWHRGVAPDLTIMNGDTYDLWQFRYSAIRKAHTELFEYLATQNVKYIVGNHDYKLFGKSHITFTVDSGKKVYVTHGHQGDDGMNNPLLRCFVWFLGIIERIPFMSWVDNPEQLVKHTGAEEKTEEYIRHEIASDYDIIICGHTHIKKICGIGDGITYNTTYANCGECMHGSYGGIIINTEIDVVVTV